MDRKSCIAFCLAIYIKLCQDWRTAYDEKKQKIYRYLTRNCIKFSSILYTSRCTARKDKTYLRYTFFVSNFASFRILLRFVFLIFTKINWWQMCYAGSFLLLHAGLSGKHGLLCIPHLFHQLFYFLYIGFIHVARCVHSFCYLV